MNFTKPDSLFNFGMKVSIYSEKNSDLELSKEFPIKEFQDNLTKIAPEGLKLKKEESKSIIRQKV
jgi:hypothetical protein